MFGFAKILLMAFIAYLIFEFIKNNPRPRDGQIGAKPGFITNYSQRRLTVLLLAVFLGYLGIHNFYVGRIGRGILYIFTGGFFGIGYVYDIIMIITGQFRDAWGNVVL